ncbi:MAG: hypothetical protein Q8T03_02550 [Bacteroidota bacterium]|nr:hypothetical protein [Bacteroidota bacterium]
MSELIELSEKIIQKHQRLGEKSPITIIDTGQLFMDLNEIRQMHEAYISLKKECEKMRDDIQLRLGVHRNQNNIVSGTIRFNVVQVRDVLKGINRNCLENLCDWGFKII